jgi:hypothetical protein
MKTTLFTQMEERANAVVKTKEESLAKEKALNEMNQNYKEEQN